VAPSSQQLRPERRALQWEGCCNIRDLGGLPLADGSETRFGVVVRADDISLLSEAGWRAVADYGVRRIVDLRHEDEPYEPPVDLVRIPLLDPGSIREVDELLESVHEPAEWRRRNYLFFLDRFADRFGRAVSAIAEMKDGPVLVHCAGGVDRTGLVAALVLRVAGVGVDTIAADYAESEANWAPSVDEWIAEAPDEAERRKRRILSVMPAEAMYDTMVELEREHGSSRAFLLSAGVEDDALDRLRARLRS
jgi:rhodanese-related sulfurtransferase